MKIICSILIAVASFSVCKGQNWKQATLLLNNGDSLSAEINFKDWSVSPSFIEVRKDNRIRSYNTSELNSFNIISTGQSYQTVNTLLQYVFTVPIPRNQIVFDHQDSVNVYAERIYSDATVELYSLGDADGKERFFISKNGYTQQLIHYKYLIDQDGHIMEHENNSFRQQLYAFVSDCNVPFGNPPFYSQKSIVSILKNYAACRGIESVSERKEPSRIYVGVGTSAIHWRQEGLSATSPFGSLDFQFLSKRQHNSGFVWVELGFRLDKDRAFPDASIGLLGGRYLGHRMVQGLIFSGYSSPMGPFDTGIGVAVNKRFVVAASCGLFNMAFDSLNPFSLKVKVYPRIKSRHTTAN